VGIQVVPGLAAYAVGEVGVRTADSQVENQIELSIEWGCVVLTDPGVVESRRELASLEETFLREINLKNLCFVAIYVGVQTILVPVKTENVEVFSKRLTVVLILSMGLLELILIIVGAPMKSGSKFIAATSRVRGIVAARLHNIDLA
jgi:hypothetical protein